MTLESHTLRENLAFGVTKMASLSAESKSAPNNIGNLFRFDSGDEVIGIQPTGLSKKTLEPDPLYEPPLFDPDPPGRPPVSILANFVGCKPVKNESQYIS